MERFEIANICDIRNENENYLDHTKSIKMMNFNHWLYGNRSLDERKYRDLSMLILSLNQNNIFGLGFQCQVVKIVNSFVTTFFHDQFESQAHEEVVKLSEEECWYMIKNKKCKIGNDVFNLQCEDEFCQYLGKSLPVYRWFSTQTLTSYKCTILQRSIIAKNENSFIFNSKCKAKDLFCEHFDSITVWRKNDIDTCPLTVISNAISATISENSIIFNDMSLFFVFDKVESHCGVNLALTEEGLYLALADSINNLNIFKKQKEISDYKALTDLILADENYFTKIKSDENKELLTLECNSLESTLNVFRLNDDKFLKLKNIYGSYHILYTVNGQIYSPVCTLVLNFTIFNESKFCYEDIPVQIVLNNKTMNVFLTTIGVLKESSGLKEDCNFQQEVHFHNNNFSIMRIGRNYEIV